MAKGKKDGKTVDEAAEGDGWRGSFTSTTGQPPKNESPSRHSKKRSGNTWQHCSCGKVPSFFPHTVLLPRFHRRHRPHLGPPSVNRLWQQRSVDASAEPPNCTRFVPTWRSQKPYKFQLPLEFNRALSKNHRFTSDVTLTKPVQPS